MDNFMLNWDQPSFREYEMGVDRGVLYVQNADGTYKNGVAWNGLTTVSDNTEGGEPNPIYADNIKYLNLVSDEIFKATIEAYTYPTEFDVCTGYVSPENVKGMKITQQKKATFGFCYRTKVDAADNWSDYSYKIHIIYNCYAVSSERGYETLNESQDAITFSWDINTEPAKFKTPSGPNGEIEEHKTAHVAIDVRKLTKTQLDALENTLYGVAGQGTDPGIEPRLPSPSEIYTIVYGKLYILMDSDGNILKDSTGRILSYIGQGTGSAMAYYRLNKTGVEIDALLSKMAAVPEFGAIGKGLEIEPINSTKTLQIIEMTEEELAEVLEEIDAPTVSQNEE